MLAVCLVSVGTQWVPRTDWSGCNKTSGDYSGLQVAKVVAGGPGCDRKLV